MKVLVAVKRVIDYNVKIRVKADHSDVDLTNVKMAMNPFCEIAVEEAVRLKEKGVATEVVAVTVGPKAAQEQLRTALALGADRAIHIETDERAESLAVAKLLAKVVDEEQPEVNVTREIDGGLQTVALTLPAIVTTDLRLNEPRYAKLPDIMKAKKKPLDVKTPADYGVEVASKVTLLKVESPAERKGGIKVASVDELIDKLKNEAKVI